MWRNNAPWLYSCRDVDLYSYVHILCICYVCMYVYLTVVKGGRANFHKSHFCKSANSWAHSANRKSTNFLDIPVRKSQIRKFARKEAVFQIQIQIVLFEWGQLKLIFVRIKTMYLQICGSCKSTKINWVCKSQLCNRKFAEHIGRLPTFDYSTYVDTSYRRTYVTHTYLRATLV
jgi:hypothetical protein